MPFSTISEFSTGILRMFTAVPGHAIYGVFMGFYFGIAKFVSKPNKYLILALLIPILLHGFYDFILFSEKPLLLLLFIPYLIFMWIVSMKRIKKLSQESIANEVS